MYNETAVASSNGQKQPICAVWAETTSGREGNDIASSLVKILEQTVERFPEAEDIITWSDSCVPQNRNSFMSTAVYSFLEMHPNIKSVEMKYSLPGHSVVQEVDQVHSALEKSFEISEFYSPLSLLNVIIKTNRHNPYKVIQMRDGFFINYKQYCQIMHEFSLVPFSKVAALRFEQGSYNLGYKLSHADKQFTQICVVRRATALRKNKNSTSTPIPVTLQPKPMRAAALLKEKLKDLKDMLKFMSLRDREYYERVHNITI